jgi:hypothetical protein
MTKIIAFSMLGECAMRYSTSISLGLLLGVLFVSPPWWARNTLATQPATTRPTPYQHADSAEGWIIITKTLVTEDWIVAIVDISREGTVVNDDVNFYGLSKKTGKSIRLTGSTWHTHSPDGTPSRYLGWIFKNGETTYTVEDEGDQGILEVVEKDSKVLVHEAGRWRTTD